MKRNEHQAGGRNSRRTQSKQARKTTGQTAGKFLKVELPESILTAVEGAAHAGGTDRDSFIREAIRQKVATIDTAEPGREQVLDRLTEVCNRMEANNSRSRGFHFLLASHLEKLAIERRQGCPPSETEACGIMEMLGEMDRDADQAHDDAHQLLVDLGSREQARMRLAVLDETRRRVDELQAEINRLNADPLAKGGAQ